MTRKLPPDVRDAGENATLAVGLLRGLAADPNFARIACRLRGTASALCRVLARIVHDEAQRPPKILPLFPRLHVTDDRPTEPA